MLSLHGDVSNTYEAKLTVIINLRELANDTGLGVLLFMSPRFHQVILYDVAKKMNRVFSLFQSRNPGWNASKLTRSRGQKQESIIN
ncbi:hypothetical protein PsorP6_015131 [Peronosclerospora sorghi]|uniref:Uncharacterized protein n=1 Tax=Peronosclerospora sorghi TaxID=230839 RepID=A0ACC0VTC1_9STRA|nr:hypothetical protein PsorP6_015131 [Peronosclerospora sorghi]